MSAFTPSQGELALVNHVFSSADPQKLGIVTGDSAVKVFAGSKLPPTVLGEVWAIADKENNGFLTRKGVAIALRLIGHAQNGESVNEALVDKPGPLAQIEGISKSSPLASPPASSPAPMSPQPRFLLNPPLTAEDRTKFTKLFAQCGPSSGLLAGDKARDVFIKSKLPFEKLSQIWALSDTQDRGSLDQTDFVIAMYFIQALMSGQLSSLPSSLPPGLYEQASGAPQSVIAHGTGTTISLSPNLTGSFTASLTLPGNRSIPPLSSQATGQTVQSQSTGSAFRASIPISSAPKVHFATNQSIAVSSPPWDVTPEELVRFNKFFDGLDPQMKGYIEGEAAVPFLLQSKLSDDVLAQIWDLANLNNDGRLTRDGFAVAMHLIQDKLAGKEIPKTLPESLIPPSLRSSRSAFSPRLGATQQVPEPVRDLLWDDSPPASATLPKPPPPIPVSSPVQSQSPRKAIKGMTLASTQDPFGSNGSPFLSKVQRDLLSDDDDAELSSSSVPDNSAEIGNLQNQLSSTNRSLETSRTERKNLEQTLAMQASQLSALQTQLSSAKAAYETETKLLATLRERFTNQSSEIQKTKEELIRAESDLSAVRVEKVEIEGNFLRDKEEIRDLHKKMKEVSEEMESSKQGIEKAKKETKHQKGLLAIAKKQLATREAERAKVAKEQEEAQKEAELAAQEREAVEAELAKEPEPIVPPSSGSPIAPSTSPAIVSPSLAAVQPLPASPDLVSPISPPTKSNNPFERLALASGANQRPSSPFATQSSTSPGPVSIDALQPERTGSRPASINDVPRTTSPFMHTAEETLPKIPSTETPSASSPFMHIAEASTATTVISTDNQSTDDPFAAHDSDKAVTLGSAATTPEKHSSVLPEQSAENTQSPLLPVVDLSSTENEDAFSSPDVKGKGKESETAAFNVDEAVAHFPPIDQVGPEKILDKHETDLGTQLLEKDDGLDSDSDSDAEHEFHDANGTNDEVSDKHTTEKKTPDMTDTITSPVPPAFDDTFGFATGPEISEKPINIQESTPKTDLFEDFLIPKVSSPATSSVVQASSFNIATVSTENNLSAFDESLGGIAPSSDSAQPQFSSFDDNFVFPSGNEHSDSQAPFTNGHLKDAVIEKPKSNGFDDIFTAPASVKPPSVSVQANEDTFNHSTPKPLAFDDVFSSAPTPPATSSQAPAGDYSLAFDSALSNDKDLRKALAFDNTFTPPSSTPQSLSKKSADKALSTTGSIFSAPSSPPPAPTSPSTVRSTSPPPRVSSPRPRASTGSSNEGGVPAGKPAPTNRHSKLSLRLPFGRKDKKKAKGSTEPALTQSMYLSPVAEPTGVVQSPANEDDVEPVKQLCGMGFSRTQAVVALEAHGYDVQRALNSLLGAA